MKLYAHSLMAMETLVWERVAGWTHLDGHLYIRYSNGEVESVRLDPKYIGIRDDDDRPMITRKPLEKSLAPVPPAPVAEAPVVARTKKQANNARKREKGAKARD